MAAREAFLAMEPAWLALAQVVLIDITLAGDNAVVVGMAVATLPKPDRRRALAFGIGAAALIRVALALVAVHLLAIIGVKLAGGVLLGWVCWRMFRELHRGSGSHGPASASKTLRDAIVQIAIADVSMSLDNVLAVAGAAQGHPGILVAGLVLSVLLMGVAANLLAGLLQRHRWVAWVGLVVVVYVAVHMVLEGWVQVERAIGAG